MPAHNHANRVLSVHSLLAIALLAGGCGSGGVDDPTEMGMGDGETVQVSDSLPPIDAQEGFGFVEETFTVQPGDEGIYCLRIPIPERFEGRTLALVGQDVDLPVGTHHFFLAYTNDPFPGEGDTPIPCEGDDAFVQISSAAETTIGGGKIVTGAGVGVTSRRSREGYGRLLAEGGHFVTNHHVLNLTDEALDLTAAIQLLVTDADTIPYPSSPMNCLSSDVTIEPNSSRTVTATCTTPFEIDIVLLGSHAHQHLQRFETRIFDGEQTLDEVIYESEVWDSPEIVELDEPIRLQAGQGLTFSCEFVNDSDAMIEYGLGVDSEMCASMNAYAYPVDRPYEMPPSLGTFISDNDTAMGLIDTSAIDILPF